MELVGRNTQETALLIFKRYLLGLEMGSQVAKREVTLSVAVEGGVP